MRYGLYVALFLFATELCAQSDAHYGSFVIGTDFVRPSTTMPYPNGFGGTSPDSTWPHYVRSSAISPASTVDPEEDLPWERWDQLTEIGINFASIVPTAGAMTGMTGVESILQAGVNSGVNVGIVDYALADGIHSYAALTRLHLQLESDYDMENQHSRRVTNDDFTDRLGARFDISRYPVERSDLNAVRYGVAHTTTMSGHMYRRTSSPDEHHMTMKNGGEYYISLSLFYDPIPQSPGHEIPTTGVDENTIIFRLRIYDNATNRLLLTTLDLRGAQFAGVDGYAELLMGINRFEHHVDPTPHFSITALTPATVNVNGDNRGCSRMVFDPGTTALYYELEYMPFDPVRRPVIDVDAIVISEGKAFALFNPDHLELHTDWRDDPPDLRPLELLDEQLDVLCSGTNPARVIFLPETDEGAGNVGMIKYIASRLSATSSLPFMYGSAQMGAQSYEYYINANRNCLQGLYRYPFITFETGDAAIPGEAEYYGQHYPTGVPDWGLQNMIDRYREYAEQRVSSSVYPDWIPAIQNNSYGFSDGYPTGQSAFGLDTEWLREPTTREIRCSVNLALAYGAHGIIYYNFSSTQGTDTTQQHSEGSRGFLNVDHTPRTMDRYGHDKWDSIRVFNTEYLRQIGDTLYQLRWLAGYSVQNGNEPGELGAMVASVLSERQDVAIDPVDETYVEVSEFTRMDGPVDTELRYLFVVNKRPDEGDHRHITVKLLGDGSTEWKVTDVRTGDIHIVRPTENPDFNTRSNGFTAYYEPGGAGLFRLEPITDETLDFDGSCLAGSIFIEPAATLRTKATDHLKFPTAKGIFCDGDFYGELTTYESCDTELSWEGIVARNSGQVTLSNVHMERGGVVAGSGGTSTVDNSTIQDASIALINYGGTLTSTATSSSGVSRHLSVVESGQTGNPHTFLTRDISSGSAQYGSTAINVAFGDAAIDEIECQNFWRSIRATEGWIDGDADGFAPSDGLNNSLSSESIGLEIEWAGYIDFGETVSNPTSCARNLILIDDVNGYHAIAESGSSIAARQNWWDPLDLLAIPDPIHIQGTVLYNDVRTDPIPFAPLRGESFASGGKLGKSATMVPTTSIRDTIRDAARRRDTTMVRNIAGRLIGTSAAWNAGLTTLRSLHAALRTHGAYDLIDSLLMLCLSRPDVESKLLAADIAAGDSLFLEAIEILDSYSFAGSQPLLARALVRKSLFHPLTGPGGYVSGSHALDSLRAMAIATSRFNDYIAWYPKLFSGLTQRGGPRIPKSAHRQSILDRIIPSTIEMGQNYPNPFSAVTSFTFKLPETREVKLTVHDMLGREVAVVKQGLLDRGVHSAVLHAGRLSAGMYLYRLQAGTEVLQGRMVLLR